MSAASSWGTARGESGGFPVVYRYRMNAPEQDFPNALSVRWPFDQSVRNGLPSPADNDLQVAFEDAIEPLIEGRLGYLMLVSTGDGLKQWLYYVDEPAGWIAALNGCLSGHPRYPLQIEYWAEPDWQTWRNFIASVGPSRPGRIQ